MLHVLCTRFQESILRPGKQGVMVKILQGVREIERRAQVEEALEFPVIRFSEISHDQQVWRPWRKHVASSDREFEV